MHFYFLLYCFDFSLSIIFWFSLRSDNSHKYSSDRSIRHSCFYTRLRSAALTSIVIDGCHIRTDALYAICDRDLSNVGERNEILLDCGSYGFTMERDGWIEHSTHFVSHMRRCEKACLSCVRGFEKFRYQISS